MRVNPRKLALLAVAVVMVLSVSACGSSGGSSTATSSGGETGGSTEASGGGGAAAAAGIKEAQVAVAAGYKGTERMPPSSGPAAQKGKTVWVISCIQAGGSGCSVTANAIEEAATHLGWQIHLVDGKGDPNVQNQAIRQAVAEKADGIIDIAIDCPAIKNSLQVAKDAGIPVVGVYAFDCNDPAVGGPQLFAASVNYGTKSIGEYFENWGRLRADYAIAQTEGKAKIVELPDPTFLLSKYGMEGFNAQLKEKCPECEVQGEVEIPFGEVVEGTAGQKVETILAQHPEADVLVPAYDPQTQGIAQAIKASGRSELLVLGGEGFLPNLELIREGTQSVAVATSVELIGWAGADTLNRVFAGETEIPDQGAGYTIINQENNLPPKGQNWKTPVDYQAGFEAVWSGR